MNISHILNNYLLAVDMQEQRKQLSSSGLYWPDIFYLAFISYFQQDLLLIFRYDDFYRYCFYKKLDHFYDFIKVKKSIGFDLPTF